MLYAAGPKIDLNDSLSFQILRVERDFLLLLLPVGFDQQRIAKVVVMEMERGFEISVSVGLDDLPVRNLCVLDEDIYIRAAFPIRSADKPFNRKPVIGFMRRKHDRRETAQNGNGQDPFTPS